MLLLPLMLLVLAVAFATMDDVLSNFVCVCVCGFDVHLIVSVSFLLYVLMLHIGRR